MIRWSGFLYGENDAYYVNAYLPATLKRWLELSTAGVTVDDIMVRQYRADLGLSKSKAEFLTELGENNKTVR